MRYLLSSPPTPKNLLDEADTALSSRRWAIIDRGTESTQQRLYDAAALRHTCGLLHSIGLSAKNGDELTVRILGRAHTEAFLTGVYIHFAGSEAIDRIAADTLQETTITNDAIKRHDAELSRDKKKARKKLKAVQAANADITLWNTQHPELPQKPLHDDPYIPRQSKSDIDLSTRIANFASIEAESLPLSVVTDKVTALGPQHGFARERFTHLYLQYRLLSAASAHPTLHLYDSYFAQRGHFIQTTKQPTGDSVIIAIWISALYSTALHIGWVLHDAGQPAPIADEVRARLEPDPTTKGWSPGK